MKRLPRTSLWLLLGALVLPGVASAHVANVEYKFPLPIWLYAVAAAGAVLVSAPAAAFAIRAPKERLSGDIYRFFRPLHLSLIATVITSLLLLDALLGGFWGDPVSTTANPAPLLIWVDFWVGLGVVSALVGNLWDFASPLNALGRGLDARLARRGIRTRAYPQWLGVWPSVLLLIVWAWAELVWDSAARGQTLALLAISYFAWQLLGMAIFGAEVWLARCELFTVLARTFARFAPLEFYVREATEPCQALRCEQADTHRINCPACWRTAAPEMRGIRFRPYGAGIRREPLLGPGGGALVVIMLATVVYDGMRASIVYANFVDWAWPNENPFAQRIGVATLLIGLTLFTLAFIAGCALVSLREEGSVSEIAGRYAPSLIPIAAVYFISHYFLYWLYLAQLTPGTVADPFEKEWVRDYQPWTPLPGWAVWWLQVSLILWGHVVAVIEAHRISVPQHRSMRRALLAQLPLVALMVAYTFSGLWVLGQQLKAQ